MPALIECLPTEVIEKILSFFKISSLINVTPFSICRATIEGDRFLNEFSQRRFGISLSQLPNPNEYENSLIDVVFGDGSFVTDIPDGLKKAYASELREQWFPYKFEVGSMRNDHSFDADPLSECMRNLSACLHRKLPMLFSPSPPRTGYSRTRQQLRSVPPTIVALANGIELITWYGCILRIDIFQKGYTVPRYFGRCRAVNDDNMCYGDLAKEGGVKVLSRFLKTRLTDYERRLEAQVNGIRLLGPTIFDDVEVPIKVMTKLNVKRRMAVFFLLFLCFWFLIFPSVFAVL